jgi:DNA-binding PadR family transcriptional regulator
MVSWTVLGIVIEQPSHGYELAVRFEQIYGDLLELSGRSHIYAALDSLARKGLIEAHPNPPDVLTASHRHPKTHYEATAQGIKSHREWLAGQLAEQHRRSRRFTIQLAALDPQKALEVLDQCEQQILRDSTRPATPRPGELASDTPERLADRLSVEQERLSAHSRLAWVEYARRQLGTNR